MGHKTKRGKYHDWITEEGLIKIEGWARDGLTDVQIASNMGIASSTLYEWQNRYSEIKDALKKGKEVVDREVENALYKKAMGYEYEEVKTYIQEIDGKVTKRKEVTKKHYAPDTTAQIFWLKNRKPVEWRDNETDLDIKEQEARIDKTIAQTRAIDGLGKDIEDLSDIRKLLKYDE